MLPTEVAILLDPSLSQFRALLITTDHYGPLQVPYVVNLLRLDTVLFSSQVTRTRVTELAELRDVESQLD
jgi:hypothetical protein